MTKFKNLHYDDAGRVIPFGLVRRSRTADFMDGALPSWLSASAGTLTMGDPTTGPGFAQLTTGATSGNTATLQSALPVFLNQVEAVQMDIEGFWLGQNNIVGDVIFNLRSTSGGEGAYAIQRSTEGFMKLGKASDTAGSEVETRMDVRGGGRAGNSYRSFSLLLVCPTPASGSKSGELFLFQSGSLVGYRDLGTFFDGAAAYPRINLVTREAVAKSFRVKQFTQTVWVN